MSSEAALRSDDVRNLGTYTSAIPKPYFWTTGLSKTYGTFQAVHDVSIGAQEGQMIALLGPSGCGKSTTLRLIAGFLEASGGRIVLDGLDYTGVPPHARDMGMVFQSYALFPHMTVAQNVAFGLRMRRCSKSDTAERVAEMLRIVRLDSVAERYPAQLSGGQQQRVALARALAIRPKLLLLDEPLSNLDANLRKVVAREIRELQKSSGLTTIMVTHDQEEAMIMADRLVLMKDGLVQQQGSQLDLYERPANPFVAKFIGESNILSGELIGGTRFKLNGHAEIRLCGFYPACNRATLSVRPEHIRRPAANETARASLAVVDATYIGAHIDYLLAVSDSCFLTMRESTAKASSSRVTRGDILTVTWDSNHERLYDESDTLVSPLNTATNQ